MSTTAYITTRTAAAVARRMKQLGYPARVQDVAKRYVVNVVPAFAGTDGREQLDLEAAILSVLDEHYFARLR